MPDRAQIVRVVCAIAGTAAVPALWWMGLVGGGKYDEHVANWNIQVVPTEHWVLVVESIEMDFGNEARTGIDREISNQLGTPTAVYGLPFSSTIEPDGRMLSHYEEVPIRTAGGVTIARLEDGGGPLTKLHTLIASYALPTVLQVGDSFEYELIAPGRSVDANDVTVVIYGVELDAPTCHRRSNAQCQLQRTEEGFAVRLASLPADDSLTIGGTITATTPPADRSISLQSDQRSTVRGVRWALWGLTVPAAIAGWNIPLSRWRRRNKARWAAPAEPALDAVTGEPSNVGSLPQVPSIAPWEGAALFHHEVGLPVAAAWFAQQVADDVLTAGFARKRLRFHRGPNIEDADLGMADELRRMFGRHDDLELDPYERSVKRVVTKVRTRQASSLQVRAWWRRFSPGGREWFSREALAVLAAWALVISALIATRWSYSWPVAIALLLVVPASTNAAIAWWMAPQLSVEGEDAVAAVAPLQQLLQRADSSHVEAAHEAGLLPQYSAWAVALGAANRWREAILAADLPDDAAAAALRPLEMGSNGGPWSLATDFPSNELQPPLRPAAVDG
ncbi:MAG: hypothetical protein ABMA25_24015 [Ilumatobacteraceae bacterium]